jgi:hypothetical protein
MKGKPLFVIIATITVAWALWSGVLGVYFEKIGGAEGSSVLNIDKNSGWAASVDHSARRISSAISKLSGVVFSKIGGPVLIQQCREQPVLCGALFIFFGVSACGIAFIVHLIRTDSRLS